MAGLTAIVDTLPDTNSFLPRYLTVQLLKTLAATIKHPLEGTPEQLSQEAKNFIATIKKPDLFNPLTYSIFWREAPETILEKYTDSLDNLDDYTHSALTIAVANEDFVLATKLIDKGANVFLEDKLILEITLTSMMQRDPNILQKLLENTQAEDQVWIKEYLDHLYTYVTGKRSIHKKNNRDIINPPVRHFGQVLDTLVYFNGTPSHYGFLSPSIDVLTIHLKSYVAELKDQATIDLFKPIADAFDFFQTNCKFIGNLPTTQPADELAKRINYNLASNNRTITMLAGGWAGNAVSIAFINKYLILTNLGTGGDPKQGTKIYNIKDAANISTESVNLFIRGLGTAAAPQQILAFIGNLVDPKPIFTISQPLNPIDNCIFVNPRAIIQGILLVLDCCQKNNSVTTNSLATLATNVEEMYKSYLNSLYMHSTDDLARFMRNHELLQNKRIECCSLALEYINQHYNDPDALKRCIELKNALEFVGLHDYYIKNITTEAKEAIKKVVIREQEITAIRVIEQEYTLMSKPQ